MIRVAQLQPPTGLCPALQIAVHHTADGDGADLMACVLHDPSNEVDVAAIGVARGGPGGPRPPKGSECD